LYIIYIRASCCEKGKVIMEKILSMLLIAGIVVLIFWLSGIREKRVQTFSDEFCRAFIEASDHILDGTLKGEQLNYTVDASALKLSGKVTKDRKKIPVIVSPIEEQPEEIQKLFNQGIDAFVLERFKTMHIKRDGAQQYLTSINLIEKKYNSAMNRIYDIANLSFSALEDITVLKTQEDLDNFHFFLHKQDFIRSTTLNSIMSKEAQRISIG